MAAPNDAALMALADNLARRLLASGRALVTAESCTGGWVAKACTDLAGSSRWFLGGAVSYSNDAKTRLLGVTADLIVAHGAVSEPVVRAMALGALDRLGGDLSVAVSGVAGPGGGTVHKPVGTVWFAWAVRDPSGRTEVASMCQTFPGDRESVRRWTVQRALEGLLER
jgi:nicotinamide-nucleotide amidase